MAYPVVPHPLSPQEKHRIAFAAVLAELKVKVEGLQTARKYRPTPPPAVFILDWDDTCCATSFLERSGCMADLDSRIDEFAPAEAFLLRILEARVLSLLKKCVSLGTALIVTNAGDGWVELSSSRFLPAVYAFLVANYNKVKIISARDRYVEMFRNYPLQWKALTFVEELQLINTKQPSTKQPTHVVVLGDSVGDQWAAHHAARKLYSLGTPIVLKVVKFLERPTIDQLCNELGVLLDHIDAMYEHPDAFDVSMYKEPASTSQLSSTHSAVSSNVQRQHVTNNSSTSSDQLPTQALSSTSTNSPVDTTMTNVSPVATCQAVV